MVDLDRRFVVYPGVTKVDEGPGVEDMSVFYTGSHVYTGTHSMRGIQLV